MSLRKVCLIFCYLIAASELMAKANESQPQSKFSPDYAFYYRLETAELREQWLQQTFAENTLFAATQWLSEKERTNQKPEQNKRYFTIKDNQGRANYFLVILPESLESAKKYPLMFFLHGQVNTDAWRRNGQWWPDYAAVADSEMIQVFPASWRKSRWWQDHYLDLVTEIIRQLQAEIKIDRNRLYATGISDGGSGLFFWGGKLAEQFALLAPVIGHPGILADKQNKIDSTTWPLNFRNSRWFIVNAIQDRLYPPSTLEKLIEALRLMEINLEWHRLEGDHSFKTFLSAYPLIRQRAEQSLRLSYPQRLFWQGDQAQLGWQQSWLRVDKLQPATDATIETEVVGIVEAMHNANHFEIQTNSIGQLTLLLSSEMIDFNQPVRVLLNGHEVFFAKVTKDKNTLFYWAARDLDPERLYQASLSFDLDS